MKRSLIILAAVLLGSFNLAPSSFGDVFELRIYTTVIPASDRRVCLMQDPLYRIDIALKAMGYDQVPMTSYYLGSN